MVAISLPTRSYTRSETIDGNGSAKVMVIVELKGSEIPVSGKGTGKVITGLMSHPLVFAASALTLFAALVNDRVQVPVRSGLVYSLHLKRECPTVLEFRSAVVPTGRDTRHVEIDGQYVTLSSIAVVSLHPVDCENGGGGKRRGMKLWLLFGAAIASQAHGISCARCLDAPPS